VEFGAGRLARVGLETFGFRSSSGRVRRALSFSGPGRVKAPGKPEGPPPLFGGAAGWRASSEERWQAGGAGPTSRRQGTPEEQATSARSELVPSGVGAEASAKPRCLRAAVSSGTGLQRAFGFTGGDARDPQRPWRSEELRPLRTTGLASDPGGTFPARVFGPSAPSTGRRSSGRSLTGGREALGLSALRRERRRPSGRRRARLGIEVSRPGEGGASRGT